MVFTLVPLGNKGEKYVHTRHNAARIVTELIKEEIVSLDGVELFIPDTFMNESGSAVSEYLRYKEGRELIIMYDDKDLAFGTFRIAFDRNSGGHNGLASVIESLGKKDFIRIRIGIAPHDVNGKEVLPPHGEDVQSYVMGHIKEDEEESLREISSKVLDAIAIIEKDGYKKAMEKYN